MFGFGKTKPTDEESKRAFLVDMLSTALAIQFGLGGTDNLNDHVAKAINLKALGYICGYCDAACQVAFSRQSNLQKDLLLTELVLIALFGPEVGKKYMELATLAIREDHAGFKQGLMKGGREYIEWTKSINDPNPYTPIGLAGYLLGVEDKNI